jgi:fructose-bisphosphate aldolase class I
MDGDHSIERCYDATRRTLLAVFAEVIVQRCQLDGLLLKANMVLSGSQASNRAPAEEVARLTLQCFKDTVPAAVPGIVFLSGGQSDEEATVNLDAINRHAAQVGAPWELSFSYGRGLQAAPQKAWSGKRENLQAAQRAFYHRAKVTAAARQGRYTPEMEKELAPAG